MPIEGTATKKPGLATRPGFAIYDLRLREPIFDAFS
jgi:hypothetical protein